LRARQVSNLQPLPLEVGRDAMPSRSKAIADRRRLVAGRGPQPELAPPKRTTPRGQADPRLYRRKRGSAARSV